MRYLALATDYDGTLAHHGLVDDATRAGLEKLLATGRKLIMVTGRRLDDLAQAFPPLDLFKYVVAENGALLYCPGNQKWKTLAEPPLAEFVDALRMRGVEPLEVGRVIVASWEPHEKTMLEVIHELGLELQVIFNKGAVMVLPSGVNKATGLAAALQEMKLSPHNVVGIGDAENDHAFLSMSGCSAAVKNALQSLKDHADVVTKLDHGQGVVELIDRLLEDDLEQLDSRLTRHHVLLGTSKSLGDVRIAPAEATVLIAGSSGSGKSTVAAGLIERLMEQNYQCCIIDPEGDHAELENAAVLGNSKRPPTVEEILNLLDDPAEQVVANLINLPLAERPPFFLKLLPQLQELRAHTGRPHWIVADEAHHLLPAEWEPGELAFPRELNQIMWITVDPSLLAPAALDTVRTVIAVGSSAPDVLRNFAAIVGEPSPLPPVMEPERGHVIYWQRHEASDPMLVKAIPARCERRRHVRKYAEGELPPERSFYFRGPEDKLKLRAQNLFTFLSLAEGLDDDTWLYHLQRGDYSAWFRGEIKDSDLANRAVEIEQQFQDSAPESRNRMKAAIEERYTLPAAARLPIPGTDAAGHSAQQPAIDAARL